jgi:6-phosphofructokinase 2
MGDTARFDQSLMKAAIVTLTINPVHDVSTEIDNVVPERKLRCSTPKREPGGGGINVSRAIRALGGESLALYPAGGPPGEVLQKLLTDERITHRCIPIEGWTRESVNVFEKTTRQQFRFIMPGPELHENEWRDCLQAVKEINPAPAFFVISGSTPPRMAPDFYAQLLRSWNSSDVRLIIDTSREALQAAAEKGPFLLKPNLRELGELAGAPIEDDKQAEESAMKIINSGKCEAVVVSLGRAGVLLAAREGCQRLRAPNVKIQSKVGAGDSMVAGIVLSLARGTSLLEAVRFGVAAGSAAVMTPGTELCRREDAEQLYKQMRS